MLSGYSSKKRVSERYKIIGFISSGTYGRVYKAQGRTGQVGEFAIKKFVVPLSFLLKILLCMNVNVRISGRISCDD